MSDYSRRLIQLQDALAAGWITNREYEKGVTSVRRRHGMLGWGATFNGC